MWRLWIVLLLIASPSRSLEILPGHTLVTGIRDVATPVGGTASQAFVIAVDPATGSQHEVSTGGLLSNPVAVAADGMGNAYVVDSDRLLRIDLASGLQTVLSDDSRLLGGIDVEISKATGELIVLSRPLTPGFHLSRGVAILSVDGALGTMATLAIAGAANDSSEWQLGNALDTMPDGDILFMNPTGCGGGCRTVYSLGHGTTESRNYEGSHHDMAISANGEFVFSALVSLGYAEFDGPVVEVAFGPLLDGVNHAFPLEETAVGIEFDAAGNLLAALSDQILLLDADGPVATSIASGGLLTGVVLSDITIVPVPELGTGILLLGGLGILTGRRLAIDVARLPRPRRRSAR